MKLFTEIPIKAARYPIDYDSKLLLLGSCFTENIGKKINYYKFQNVINPFGILFHPKSIEALINNAISGKKYDDASVFFHNDQWHCYESHSKLSHPNKFTVLNTLNNNIKITNKQIKEASHIIITLGTAWVYRLLENNNTVANCHKVPQKAFKKELLSIQLIIESIEKMLSGIRRINNKVSVIFTVSPVRHIKDGFVENTQSKAHLISAIHEVINNELLKEPKRLSYFPSYEIMMDTLREYRFYKADLLHPNETAIEYIWGCFKKCYINEATFKVMEDIAVIQKGLSHIPSHPNSKAHLKFIKQLNEKKELISEKITHITFKD